MLSQQKDASSKRRLKGLVTVSWPSSTKVPHSLMLNAVIVRFWQLDHTTDTLETNDALFSSQASATDSEDR